MIVVQDFSSVRADLRELVRGFGFLSPTHQSGLSFSKVHALIEIDNRKLSAKDLSTRLSLDKSSVSRLLRSLLKDKLIVEKNDKQDARSKLLSLTTKGRDELAIINAQADSYLQGLFDYLSPKTVESFSKSLSDFTRAQQFNQMNNGLELALINKEDDERFAELAKAVLTEFGANGEGFAFVDPELQTMSKVYNNKGWCYYVVKEDGVLLGGAGVGPLQGGEKDVCELKKMYLAKESRGKGLGKLLLNRILKEAKAMGYHQCYLETLASMKSANALYRAFNFKPLDKPMGKTGHDGCDRWYLVDLTPA